ncbi:hypothetical protein Pen02_80950 [Plantactinospora endophytica]|uniref:Uncharacterized protein n=1 Tax=Plantactinospora endophytica TaxID=673535 RepID=A0ABQ4EEK9_9ACTN|nr:hypothetical protein Pen02_80950 [Plantactinospora endophytica]
MEVDDPYVIPSDESDRHATYGCPCGAETEAVTRPDGSATWLVIHRRWDGRNLLEPRPLR